MLSVDIDWTSGRQALERESGRVAAMLRDGAPLDVPVPGLAWTTAQLAAHLCQVCRVYAATLRGEDFGGLFGGLRGTLPEAVAAANAMAVRDASFPGPEQAADQLTAAAAGLLAALDGRDDLGACCPTPWYGPGASLPVGVLMALSVSELLVHGRDLARALRRGVRPTAGCRASATAVAAAVMSGMLPYLLDERRAAGFAGAFEVRVREAQRFVLRVADGRAWSEPVGAAGARGTDCVVSMDAWTALLVGFDRLPLWRAVASGGVVAFGRRPWLGPRLHTLFLTA